MPLLTEREQQIAQQSADLDLMNREPQTGFLVEPLVGLEGGIVSDHVLSGTFHRHCALVEMYGSLVVGDEGLAIDSKYRVIVGMRFYHRFLFSDFGTGVFLDSRTSLFRCSGFLMHFSDCFICLLFHCDMFLPTSSGGAAWKYRRSQ